MEGVEDLMEKLNSTWQEISTKLYAETEEQDTDIKEDQSGEPNNRCGVRGGKVNY